MGSTTSSRRLALLAGAFVLAACASAPPPGRFAPPLERLEVSSEFGEPRGRSRRHRGVDLRAPRGTRVLAAAPGRVVFAGRRGAFGRLVVIGHGAGLESYYAHLSGIEVVGGQRVGAGQRIGRVGASGNATGPHLHFELREGGRPVDPGAYVRLPGGGAR